MAVYLLVLCVVSQAIITTSLGASVPHINLETSAVPIQPLSSPPAGKTLRSSPKVPSRSNDILTEYLKTRDSITELPLPSSPTSLSKVSSRASDILFDYFKSQSSSTSTGTSQLLSPKVPSKATGVLLDYFKTQYPTTDWSPDSKTPSKIGLRYASTEPACSISIHPPSQSYDTKTFGTVPYPPSFPTVDVYKTSASKTYQPIYPPTSTLPSLNNFSPTSVTSLPTISSDALKTNVNSLNQESKFASPLYFSNISPISEHKTSGGSVTPANLQYPLPYPLQYNLQSLPKVITPPVTDYLNLRSPKYAMNRRFYSQQPLPKLNSSVFNDKSKFNLKTAPKVPFSTNPYVTSSIKNSDQTIIADSINPLRDQIVIRPVKPFPISNLEIPSRKTRPIVDNMAQIKPIDGFHSKLNHNDNDGVKSINLNSNLLTISNSLPRYPDLGIENRITEIDAMLLSADILIPNTPEIPIPNVTICTQSVANIMPGVFSPTIPYVPSYTHVIPSNYYLNVSPFPSLSTTSPSSSVSDILSNIVYTYLPYLISTRRKPEKSAKVLPLNPYSIPKHMQSSPISFNPRLSLPMFTQATKNQMVCPLVSAPTSLSLGPSTINSQPIDMTSLYYDFCTPSLITYSPDITAPIAQVTPTVPLTVKWLPPVTFVDYSPSQIYSHSLPSSVLPRGSEFSLPSAIVGPPPIVHVKSLDKSIEKLLEFIYLTELIKGKGSVDWDAIEMALALLCTI